MDETRLRTYSAAAALSLVAACASNDMSSGWPTGDAGAGGGDAIDGGGSSDASGASEPSSPSESGHPDDAGEAQDGIGPRNGGGSSDASGASAGTPNVVP
jgi:hypothetical protein